VGLKAGPVDIPTEEIDVTFARSGGPGGQNVNKVATKVVLRWRPAESAALTPAQLERITEKLASRITNDGDLLVTSERTRYQDRNRDDAMAKLATLVKDALHVPKKRRKTRPTAASRQRRIDAKKRRGSTKRMRREPPDD
jgi:ribosome-associated protein